MTVRRSLFVPALLLLFGTALPARAIRIYGVTTQNALISFDSQSPSTLGTSVPLSGLRNGSRWRRSISGPRTGGSTG